MPDGEPAKRLATVEAMAEKLVRMGADRRGENHRLHLGISGLQTNLPSGLAVETLERGFIAANQGDDDFAGIGHLRLLDDHEIAVQDVIVHHGIAFHAKYIVILPARELAQ